LLLPFVLEILVAEAAAAAVGPVVAVAGHQSFLTAVVVGKELFAAHEGSQIVAVVGQALVSELEVADQESVADLRSFQIAVVAVAALADQESVSDLRSFQIAAVAAAVADRELVADHQIVEVAEMLAAEPAD
jgi:hypothetical protein